jgi:hypothetical protein
MSFFYTLSSGKLKGLSIGAIETTSEDELEDGIIDI